MFLRIAALAAFLLVLPIVFGQVLPKPQIANAEGQLAPDFELRDQAGKTFRLSSTRGRRVLLVFYRGNW